MLNVETVKTTKVVAVLAIVLAMTGPATLAQVIHVDDDAGPGGDGQAWETAFRYLQDALVAAQTYDEIHVAGGTYQPDQDEGGLQIPLDRQSHFHLINNVSILGGYRGCPGGDCSGDPDERDIDLYETILDGDLLGDDDPNDVGGTSYDDNCYHVVIGTGNDDTAVLGGVTIRGGNADGAAYDDRGGGLQVMDSVDPTHPTISQCTFKENFAKYGGGVLVRETAITLSECTFENNRANEGAGVFFRESAGTITDGWFENNVATSYGGGLRLYWYSTAQIQNTTFFQNFAPNNASGVSINQHSDPAFTNCDFIGNTAQAVKISHDAHPYFSSCTFDSNLSPSDGAGLHIDGAEATLTDCHIINNAAEQDGGGMWIRAASVELVDCTIESNSADIGAGFLLASGTTDATLTASGCAIISNTANADTNPSGGGVYITGTVNADFEGCLIAGNSAHTGAGAYIYSLGDPPCVASFINCLIAGNVATGHAGALYVDREVELTATNCTLVNNDAAVARALYCTSHNNSYPSEVAMTNCIVRNGGDEILNADSSVIEITYSNITGSWGDPTDYNIDADPLFVDEDGPDDDPATWYDNDWHLQREFSPCVDAGFNAADTDISDPNANPLPDTDYDGWPRFQDDDLAADCPQGGDCGDPPIVDMGAFEVWSDCNANSVPDVCEVTANCDSLWPCDPNDCATTTDCDTDGVPDECQIAADPNLDCNVNGILDECDLADCDGSPWCDDCNGNGALDECDITSGYSWDGDGDGIPDECQPCVSSAWDILIDSQPAEASGFGHAVAVYGEWLFVGVPDATVGGVDSAGKVIVARQQGAHWRIVDVLTSGSSGDAIFFGVSVAVHETIAAVGVTIYGDAGAIYVFRLNELTDVWEQDAILEPTFVSPGAGLGHSLALDADDSTCYLVAGAANDDTFAGEDAGSAVLYEFDKQSGQWDAGYHLLPPAGPDDHAASAIDVSASVFPHVVIGAPGDDGPDDLTEDVGAVYRWAKSSGYWTLDPVTYRLDGGAAADNFGRSVAVNGADCFVGCPNHENPSGTSGLVAVLGATSELIMAPLGTQVPFGSAIDVRGNRLAVLTAPFFPGGHAYLYQRSDVRWVPIARFDQGTTNGAGPECVALGSDWLFMGDFSHNAACEYCGAVLIFGPLGDCNTNDWIDVCEIASGAATDCNLTGMPDECELIAGGDFDADGDVDNEDYAALAEALAGPDLPPDPNDPACVDVYLAAFDTEPDTDLDLHDFAAFQRAFSGPLLVPPPGMALVPAGEFEMGDPFDGGYDDELPLHTVHLSAYFIDGYEVTNAQYAAALNWAWAQGGLIEVTVGGVVKKAGDTEEYCDTTTSSSYSRIEWDGSTFTVTAGKEDHPMVEVSWYGAVAFSNWRSVMAGRTPCYDLATWTCDFDAAGFRLPTEAEWEKAAGWDPDLPYHFRFGEHTDGCGESCLNGQRANYGESGDPFETGPYPWTTPVGYYDGSDHGGYQTQDAQSYYGCRDMSGNVWEWCHDWYDSEYYDSSPYGNPTGPDSGTSRVLRGGSWVGSPYYCRSANRLRLTPDVRSDYGGFRCALGTP